VSLSLSQDGQVRATSVERVLLIHSLSFRASRSESDGIVDGTPNEHLRSTRFQWIGKQREYDDRRGQRCSMGHAQNASEL